MKRIVLSEWQEFKKNSEATPVTTHNKQVNQTVNNAVNQDQKNSNEQLNNTTDTSSDEIKSKQASATTVTITPPPSTKTEVKETKTIDPGILVDSNQTTKGRKRKKVQEEIDSHKKQKTTHSEYKSEIENVKSILPNHSEDKILEILKIFDGNIEKTVQKLIDEENTNFEKKKEKPALVKTDSALERELQVEIEKEELQEKKTKEEEDQKLAQLFLDKEKEEQEKKEEGERRI